MPRVAVPTVVDNAMQVDSFVQNDADEARAWRVRPRAFLETTTESVSFLVPRWRTAGRWEIELEDSGRGKDAPAMAVSGVQGVRCVCL